MSQGGFLTQPIGLGHFMIQNQNKEIYTQNFNRLYDVNL